MELNFDDLTHKTVAELREIAQGIEHEALDGYTTMHKDHLVPALCKALGLEAHQHHDVVGIDKSSIKARIRQLKLQRDAALEAHDHQQPQLIRRQIHRLKHALRKATV